MLRFFRVNDPYRLAAILLILVLCSLPLFLNQPAPTRQDLKYLVVGESVANGQLMYARVYDATAPLAAVVFGAIDWVFGRSTGARQFLALVIIFFQAAFFAILLINNRAYNDNTYLPGLIYGVLCFVSFDFFSVSPELLASTVLLLALNNLFREIEFRIQRDETILTLGLFIGLASLFIFSYSLFLLAAILVLILFTRISPRKTFLLLFGFGLPHGFVFAYYFYHDELTLLWFNFYLPSLSWKSENLVSFQSLFILAALPLVYFIFSLFMLTREARFTKYQSQLFQVMFLWMLFSLVEVFITRERTPRSFITLIPSLTYFFSHYLLLIRRKWIAEISLWVLVAGIMTVSTLARTGKISSIDYSPMALATSRHAMRMEGRKVMVLGDDLAVYRKNELGGYFLNWELSERTVTETQYYSNIKKMDEMFKLSPPDVIVDERGLFPAIADRIPSLRLKYEKDGVYYWKKK